MKPTSIDSNGVFFPTSATKDGIALRQLPIAELFGWAERLKADGQAPIAAELYKAWIALNGDHDLLYAVYFNFGVALSDLDDRLGAINAFRDSIRLKPDFMPPSVNLGRALEDVGQAGSALSEWLNAAAKLAAVNGESVKQKTTLLTQAGRLWRPCKRTRRPKLAQAGHRTELLVAGGHSTLDRLEATTMQMADY